MPSVSIKQVTDAVSAALKPVQDAVTALRGDVATLQSDTGATAVMVEALDDAVSALEAAVYAETDPLPEPEPEPQPVDDWATESAGALVAYEFKSAGPEDANLTARHRSPGNTAPICYWVPNEDTYQKPVIDDYGMRFDVVPNKGSADCVVSLRGSYGKNSRLRLRWRAKFNRSFIDTVFTMTGGGYPGIKLLIAATLDASSPSGKFVLSTMDQHKFPFGYRYNWQTGATENFEPAVGTVGQSDFDYDWQPKQGQPATCLYTVTNKTPQGQAVPGCDTLVADVETVFELEIDTGDVVSGTDGKAWDCEYRFYMTVGTGPRKLVFDYGKTTRGYQGRRAEPFTAVWLVPFMTGRDLTQQFPLGTPSVWYKRWQVAAGSQPSGADVPLPEPEPQPEPQPGALPAEGTFRAFTVNTPASVATIEAVFFKGMLANWCGGTYSADYGTYGAALYYGGGEHFSWPDKGGVIALNCAERRYEMTNLSSVTTHMGPAGTAGSPTDEWGAYRDNHYPQQKHTYNCLGVQPASQGGGPKGSLLCIGHSGGYSPETQLAGDAATWRFDLSQPVDGHSRLNGDAKYFIYAEAKTTVANTNDSSFGCWDSKREGTWHSARTSAYGRGLSFTHRSGRVDNFTKPPLALAAWASMHYMADDDLLCVIHDEPKFGQNRFGCVSLLKLDGPPGDWTTILPTVPNDEAMRWNLGLQPGGIYDIWNGATHGDPNPAQLSAGYTGAQWSTLLGGFVGFDYRTPAVASSTARVWVLTPPPAGQRFTGTWSWRVETATSADGSVIDPRNDDASVNGAFSKLVECVGYRSLVWTRGVQYPGVLIRLRGM